MNKVLIWGDLSLDVLGLTGLIIMLITIGLIISIILYYISKIKIKNIINVLNFEPGDKLYVKADLSNFDQKSIFSFKQKLVKWSGLQMNDIIIIDSKINIELLLFKRHLEN